jgi:RNA 2',3'-cyclic 3'-phosphodiesterase
MRLFVAIALPDDIVAFLKEIQSSLEDVRLSADFHLTLKFLGDVDDPDRVVSSLSQVRFPMMQLETTQLGAFPDKDHIRVLWVGLEPDPSLIKLQSDIDEVLPGFKKDFSFHPHITLARVDRKIPFPDVKVDKKRFIVDRFCLFESMLTPKGPIYRKIQEFKAS